MSEKSTFGRRTWDREEYAELARKRKEAFKQGQNPDAAKKPKLSSTDTLDFHKDLNKRTIITGTVTKTRGKAFGFYCAVCDLTFKDNLKYIDHLNSKQHYANTEQQQGDSSTEGSSSKNNRVITLEDVKKRYDMLCKKLDEIDQNESLYVDGFNVKKRMEEKARLEREKREEGTRKRIEKEQRAKEEEAANADQDMLAMMGISGFGSSKP